MHRNRVAAAAVSPWAASATGGTANIMIYAVNTDGTYWHAIMSGVIATMARPSASTPTAGSTRRTTARWTYG